MSWTLLLQLCALDNLERRASSFFEQIDEFVRKHEKLRESSGSMHESTSSSSNKFSRDGDDCLPAVDKEVAGLYGSFDCGSSLVEELYGLFDDLLGVMVSAVLERFQSLVSVSVPTIAGVEPANVLGSASSGEGAAAGRQVGRGSDAHDGGSSDGASAVVGEEHRDKAVVSRDAGVPRRRKLFRGPTVREGDEQRVGAELSAVANRLGPIIKQCRTVLGSSALSERAVAMLWTNVVLIVRAEADRMKALTDRRQSAGVDAPRSGGSGTKNRTEKRRSRKLHAKLLLTVLKRMLKLFRIHVDQESADGLANLQYLALVKMLHVV